MKLRTIKVFFDHVLIGLDNLLSAPILWNLKEGQFYGDKSKINLVDQLRSPNPKLVTGYYQKINDPKAAKRFGTNDLDQYSFWSWRSCGVACVLSILKTHNLNQGSLYDLVKKLETTGGYLYTDRWGRKDIGWKHAALKNALVDHGLHAELQGRLSSNRLLSKLKSKKMIIASTKTKARE